MRNVSNTGHLAHFQFDWMPKDVMTADMLVGVRVALGEVELQRKLKKEGARWKREDRVWNLPYADVLRLGIEDRIVGNS